MGYVIVAILAFALGICVTLLGAHVSKRKKDEEEVTK